MLARLQVDAAFSEAAAVRDASSCASFFVRRVTWPVSRSLIDRAGISGSERSIGSEI